MKLASPLQFFIIASAGIHAGFVLMPGSAGIVLPGNSGSTMSVILKEPVKTETHLLAKKTLAKKTSETVAQNNKKMAHKKVASRENKETEKTAQAASASQENAESKARVISLIYKELNNHFNYPKIAQRRNWQGQVQLAFRLSNDGTIKDIKINHSSGYNVLDQAAIVSLKKIGQLPQASSWLVDGMEIQIPVIYQLTQG